MLKYQKWPNFDNFSHLSSKLDPNSKPFSPRKMPFAAIVAGKSKFSAANLDENDNKVDPGGDREDKMRQIWAKTPINPENLAIKTNNNKINEPQRQSITKTADLDIALKPSLEYKDDFGLRSLAQNIKISKASMNSETCSLMSDSYLGLSRAAGEFLKEKPNMYSYFESPLSNTILSPMSDYCEVPEEYLHGLSGKQLLPKLELNRLATDLLFFLFYNAVGDSIQLQAASELYNRGWRFNITQGLWVARLPNVNPDIRHKTYEKGLYQYFNPITWRRETKNMTLYYSELSLKNQH